MDSSEMTASAWETLHMPVNQTQAHNCEQPRYAADLEAILPLAVLKTGGAEACCV